MDINVYEEINQEVEIMNSINNQPPPQANTTVNSNVAVGTPPIYRNNVTSYMKTEL